MTANILELFAVDGERIAQSLTEAEEALKNGAPDVVLDFTAVSRLDPAALRALESLARASAEKKLTLRGVNVEIYKVLKLARLSDRFRFEN